MTPTLARLHAEHANLERLVRLLDDHASVLKTPTFGDLGCLSTPYTTSRTSRRLPPSAGRPHRRATARASGLAGRIADEIEAQHVTRPSGRRLDA